MKTFISRLSLLICLLAGINGQAQVFSFSVAPTVCFSNSWPASGNNSVAATVIVPSPGATSYSWTAISGGNSASITPLSGSNGTAATISFSACGAYTISCIPFAGASPMGNMISGTINVICPSWLTATTPNFSICPGSQLLLSASGGTTYSWYQPGVGPFGSSVLVGSGSPAVVTPTNPSSGANVFVVVATNTLGCIAQASVLTTFAWPGTPNSVSGVANPLQACPGGNFTLSASGSTSGYTWMPGSIVSSTATVFTPAASGCYTVFGQAGNNCLGSATTCFSIVPLPNLSISASPNGNTICSGSGVTLTASGATSYTWYPGGFQGATINGAPLNANTCFTLAGANAAGCTASTSTCFTVNPLPNLTLSAAISTVCQGSSTQLAATGALTYTWSNGVNTGINSVLPLANTCYSVAGTNAFGCTSTTVGCVFVNTGCSDVWPGDANNDGIVDNTDVFEIGLAFSNTGTARVPGGNAYVSQYATNWPGLVSSGKNQCHADCDGDGSVNNNDTLAIFNNYSLTHTFKPVAATSAVQDIDIATGQQAVSGGQWNKADIFSNISGGFYGLAFDINFDNSLLVSDSAYLVYTPSFLNAASQNVNFRKTVFINGKLYTASVRTSGADVSGTGKIGELWFKVKTGIADNTPLNLSISGAKKITKNGSSSSITSGSAVLPIVNGLATGIHSHATLKTTTSLYPNPASSCITLQSGRAADVSYTVFDVTGRKVMQGSFTAAKTIDLADYAAGTYIIRFVSGAETAHMKFVIEK